MRTRTLGGITVTYPEELIYSGDDQYVSASKASNHVTLEVTIGSKTLSADSSTGEVVINIYSLLRITGATGAVTATFYIAGDNPAFSTTFTDTFYVANGWTSPELYHGTGYRVIVVGGMSEVDIPCVDACTVSYDETHVSVAGAKIESIPVSDLANVGTIAVTYATKKYFGEWADPDNEYDTLFTLEHVSCVPKNGVVIRWLDMDGCRRYLVGKILSRTFKAESTAYPRQLTRQPSRHVYGRQATIEVGVAQATPDMRLGDILMSAEVVMINGDNGNTISLTPAFDNMVLPTSEANDVILTFNTMI